ncbi:hypothetical protein Slin15195_G044190 [Septoria linicola]|uniref:Uncharacterized protein n=1 Tax=Septoria linicola TaxID=215465 RepID=A0A9Q9ARA2_9PEZI|nr:hypothetical protein Slin14017_G047710 [Septoria linicola]USW51100.1 hypothetical protein Slin15195_G044190 [Septoria linicola]
MAKLEDCTEIDRTCKIAHTLGGRAARCVKKPVAKTNPSSLNKPPAASNRPLSRRGGDAPDHDSHSTYGASGHPYPDEPEEQGANMDALTVSEDQELSKKCEGANKKFPMQSVCERNWIYDCTTKAFAQRCQLLESEDQEPLIKAFGMFGLCQQEYIPKRAAKCLTEEGLRKRYEGLMAFMRIAGKVPARKHD